MKTIIEKSQPNPHTHCLAARSTYKLEKETIGRAIKMMILKVFICII